MSTDPAELTLVELLPLLARRALSARELVEACLARVAASEPVVRAFVTPTPEPALAAAARADAARAAGRSAGLLAGVPVAVPVATGAPESASRELTLPEAVAAGVARVVLVAGLVQVIGSVEDFSLQELTSQDPGWATATAGAVWLVVEVVPEVCAEAVTEEVPASLR